MKPSLVIFDCDGVLIDSEIISAKMLVSEISRLGVSIDLAYVARHFLGRSYPTVMQQIRTGFGIDLPKSFEADYRAHLLEAFEKELRVMPGVRDVIDRLGVRSCVATSSSPPRVKRSLEIVGLDTVFGADVFTASQVSNGKPAPDLFLHAARGMQVEPQQCLVIEDSLNGVLAAKAAGMTVWRFVGGSHMSGDDQGRPDESRPHRRFASFAEFYQLGPELERKSEAGVT